MLLGLQEGHTEEQLRQAHHDLVKVWHPDRFGHDGHLRQVAEEKLKEINGAYEFLRAKMFEESIAPHSELAPQPPQERTPGTGHSMAWTIFEVIGIGLVAAGLFFFVNKHQSTQKPSGQTAPASTKEASTASAKWDVLFDGQSVEHWRGFRREDFPNQAWEIQNGILQTTEGTERVDLISRDEYQDFELELEWRVSAGANSGIMYHVSEGSEKSWMSGPEMQLLDDNGYPDGQEPKTSVGSLFGVIAPVNKHINPIGQWNQTRISVAGRHVEYWLNGGKIVEYELGSDAFKALVAESQFRDQPNYATQKTGRIVLQSYAGQVAFRNIMIRHLSPSSPVNTL